MRNIFWCLIVFTVASLSLMIASYGGSRVQEWIYSTAVHRGCFLAVPIVLFLLAGFAFVNIKGVDQIMGYLPAFI